MASAVELQPQPDPHPDIAQREEEDERELMRAAISRLNEMRTHSAEVS